MEVADQTDHEASGVDSSDTDVVESASDSHGNTAVVVDDGVADSVIGLFWWYSYDHLRRTCHNLCGSQDRERKRKREMIRFDDLVIRSDGIGKARPCRSLAVSVFVDEDAANVFPIAQILIAVVDVFEFIALGDHTVQIQVPQSIELEQVGNVIVHVG